MQLWHGHVSAPTTAGQILTRVAAPRSSNGMRLASVGSDASVRVYDEGARALEVTFEAASVVRRESRGQLRMGWCRPRLVPAAPLSSGYHPFVTSVRGAERDRPLVRPTQSGMGHSSNVYGAAWERGPGDAVLVTAGWDNSICIWDRRQRARVGSMFGAYVCGDALDLRGNEVLSGSWRDQSPLQLWDVRMRRLLTNYTTLVVRMPVVRRRWVADGRCGKPLAKRIPPGDGCRAWTKEACASTQPS